MYFVYIIETPDGRRHIGSTEDVDERHFLENERVRKYTSRFAGDWRLVWHRAFTTLKEARAHENRLKAG